MSLSFGIPVGLVIDERRGTKAELFTLFVGNTRYFAGFSLQTRR
jgi:hypothetical protein